MNGNRTQTERDFAFQLITYIQNSFDNSNLVGLKLELVCLRVLQLNQLATSLSPVELDEKLEAGVHSKHAVCVHDHYPFLAAL